MLTTYMLSYGDSYKISLIKNRNKKEIVKIGGNLYTAIDIMEKDILFSKVEINDLIFINNTGSYVYSLIHLLYSSH